MKTLLKNATIIPMTENKLSFIGNILIENGKIARIGTFDIDNISECETIECSEKLVLPSFVNGHTHLAMTLMRNYKDDSENLQAWLQEIFPIEDKLVDEDIYWASLLGIGELIKGGCTTFADMYFNTWETAKACRESGIRGIIGLPLFGEESDAKNRIINLYPRLRDAVDGAENIRIDAAVHSIYTCTAGTYKVSKEWAEKQGTYLHTHLSETKKEVDDCLKDFGTTPIKYLDSLGVLNERTYLAHGIWFDDDEIEILKERKCSIIHNPSSNCKLASGIAPVAKYRENGLNVCLGTDGASSNNNLNLLKELNLASMISSVSTSRPSSLSPYAVLEMATINGARALGLENKIGTIEIGKNADLLVMDMRKLHTSPTNDIFSAIVFSADKENIEYVFSKGRKLLDRGMLTTLDEEKIIYNTYRQWNDILRR